MFTFPVVVVRHLFSNCGYLHVSATFVVSSVVSVVPSVTSSVVASAFASSVLSAASLPAASTYLSIADEIPIDESFMTSSALVFMPKFANTVVTTNPAATIVVAAFIDVLNIIIPPIISLVAFITYAQQLFVINVSFVSNVSYFITNLLHFFCIISTHIYFVNIIFLTFFDIPLIL